MELHIVLRDFPELKNKTIIAQYNYASHSYIYLVENRVFVIAWNSQAPKRAIEVTHLLNR